MFPMNLHILQIDWGSRGRRFKSCQPDSEAPGQGQCPRPGALSYAALACRSLVSINQDASDRPGTELPGSMIRVTRKRST
jgi:hypothetical protein